MDALTWRHGTTQDAALAALKGELEKLGYARYATWDEARVSARYRKLLITMVDVAGEVTPDSIVVERCSGQFSGTVLERCREIFERLFPGGGVN